MKKAASAMKVKAARDLDKLNHNKEKLEAILAGTPINRWILVCPFLDDKDVVAYIRNRGNAIKAIGLKFLTERFEALIHSQDDFATQLEWLNNLSLGPSLNVEAPPADKIEKAGTTAIGITIDGKLRRGLGATIVEEKIVERRNAYVRAHLYRENALDQLRESYPRLWERSIQVLDAEEQRLIAVGGGSTLPAEQLRESTSRIESSLRADLPTFSTAVLTQIALGTVSDWLIRCPLDFPAMI